MNIGELIGLISVVIGLDVFGWWYDGFVARLEERHHDEGETALLVVCGVSVTLVGVGLMDAIVPALNAGLTGLVCFAASGFPMVYGSKKRYWQRREDEQQDAIRRAREAQLDGMLDDVELSK